MFCLQLGCGCEPRVHGYRPAYVGALSSSRLITTTCMVNVGAISSSRLITTTCMVNVGVISSSKRHLRRVSDQKK